MSRTLIVGWMLAVAAALALRCPQLDIRPMHNDEAVNAIKLRALWEQGVYRYDPLEYHGPTLLYSAFAWVKLTGASDFAHLTETRLRLLTVLFGAGLILLLPLVADGLGPRATVCAGMLTAISPAMVFYSRYFIHEMLLVFFTFLALGAGWRYFKTRKPGWAMLAGAGIGLMQATKETFVFSLAAIAGALALNWLFEKCLLRSTPNDTQSSSHPFRPAENSAFKIKPLIAGWLVWLLVAVTLFTSFFTNWRGPMDSLRTYLPWLRRAAGASPHIHPWNFYFHRLLWFHHDEGPVWTEALIFGLAIIGLNSLFLCRRIKEGNIAFIRFLGFYTLILTAVYCGIGYKTPWCLLGFWHGMILLAGIGAVALLDWLPNPGWKVTAGVLLLAGAGQLATQAWSTAIDYAADQRNPYVYAQTSPDILNLVDRVNSLAEVRPNPGQMSIKVMAPESEYWPLPWYLRQYSKVGWWGEMPADPYAPVMIVSTKFPVELDADKTHLMIGLFELRPQTFFALYVDAGLWGEYLAAKSNQVDSRAAH